MRYYTDNYQKELKAKVLEIFEENDKNYVVLDDYIFYAQGGGQKGDRGKLVYNDNVYDVIKCIKDENYKHYLITEYLLPKDLVGEYVNCILDFDFRYKQMRLHTALHLLHYILDQEYKDKINYPITSNIEEDLAYNKYNSEDLTGIDLSKIEDKMNNLSSQDISVMTYPDLEKENYRYWECMNYVIPCGGVHVHSLKEIGKVKLDIHEKKGIITIKIILIND